MNEGNFYALIVYTSIEISFDTLNQSKDRVQINANISLNFILYQYNCGIT